MEECTSVKKTEEEARLQKRRDGRTYLTKKKKCIGGWTALMWATTNNHAQVVELLLDHGASFETRSACGRTAFDFVDTQNQQMLSVLSHRDSLSRPTSLSLQQRMFRRHSAAPAFGHRHQLLSEEDDDNNEEEDPIDFSYYYMQHNVEQECEQHRTLMEIGQEMEDDLVSCEASMESIHTFNWNKCLPDQMFVFSEENAEHILETAITRLTLPMKSRQEIYVPANVIFLSARFAHYYSSKELLNNFLDVAVFKIAQVVKASVIYSSTSVACIYLYIYLFLIEKYG